MISKITVSNFENLEGEYQLFPHTVVRGRNGAGKSAIGRAIAWAVTGRDVYGDKRVDHLVRDLRVPMWVVLELEPKAPGAEPFILERRKTRTTTTLKINGEKRSAGDAAADPDLWLSCFWPGYFFSLPEFKQRDLFTACLPDGSEHRARLFKEQTGMDLPADYDPAQAFKRAGEARRMAERELEQAKGQAEAEGTRVREIGTRMREADGHAEDDEETLRGMAAELESYRQGLAKLREIADRHAEWKARADQAERDGKRNAEIIEARENLPDLSDLEAEIEMNHQALTEERNKGAAHEAWANRDQKRKIYEGRLNAYIQAQANTDRDGCPTCGQKPATSEARDRILAAEDICEPTEVPEPGPEPDDIDHERIHALETKLQMARDALSENRAERRTVEAMKLTKIEHPGPEPEKGDQGKINEYEIHVIEAERRLAAAKARIEARSAYSADELKRAQEAHAAAQDLVAEAEKGLAQAAKFEEAVHPKRGIERDILAWQLGNAYAAEALADIEGAVDFQLTETTKTTGEDRPCFKIQAKCRHPHDPGAYCLVPVQYASAGQRIYIGALIADFLERKSGNICGMRWFDDADLLSTDPPASAGIQVLEARVSGDTDKPKIVDAGDRERTAPVPQKTLTPSC